MYVCVLHYYFFAAVLGVKVYVGKLLRSFPIVFKNVCKGRDRLVGLKLKSEL